MLPLLRAEGKALIFPTEISQEGNGLILRTVILKKNGKIRIGLAQQRVQQSRQMFASIICSEQDDCLHQVTPHFRKYLKTDRTCLMRPLKVRVFSRAQRCVTFISG